jgi:hypothetical protein
MRPAIFCFILFSFAPLARAQGTLLAQGQGREIPSCRALFLAHDDKYYLGNVGAVLDMMRTGGSLSFVDQGIQNLGDGASVDWLKIVDPKDITKPQFVKAYLQMVRTAFSQPKVTACKEDRSPEVTLFMLGYLREEVNDKNLQRQIESTKQYVLNQTKGVTPAADWVKQLRMPSQGPAR